MLLLSYLDKICLILTGEPGCALAYLYSEARLYKGARAASLSWNSKGFILSRSNLLLHNSLHFQHLIKTKG